VSASGGLRTLDPLLIPQESRLESPTDFAAIKVAPSHVTKKLEEGVPCRGTAFPLNLSTETIVSVGGEFVVSRLPAALVIRPNDAVLDETDSPGRPGCSRRRHNEVVAVVLVGDERATVVDVDEARQRRHVDWVGDV